MHIHLERGLFDLYLENDFFEVRCLPLGVSFARLKGHCDGRGRAYAPQSWWQRWLDWECDTGSLWVAWGRREYFVERIGQRRRGRV